MVGRGLSLRSQIVADMRPPASLRILTTHPRVSLSMNRHHSVRGSGVLPEPISPISRARHPDLLTAVDYDYTTYEGDLHPRQCGLSSGIMLGLRNFA